MTISTYRYYGVEVVARQYPEGGWGMSAKISGKYFEGESFDDSRLAEHARSYAGQWALSALANGLVQLVPAETAEEREGKMDGLLSGHDEDPPCEWCGSWHSGLCTAEEKAIFEARQQYESCMAEPWGNCN